MADVRRLPTAVTETWDWQMRAACRDIDSSMFFHPERERGPDKRRRETEAKHICAGCPVIDRCRSHALAVHEPYGVWGGLTVSERQAVLYGASTLTAVGARGPVTVFPSVPEAPESPTPPAAPYVTTATVVGRVEFEPLRGCRRPFTRPDTTRSETAGPQQ